MSAADDERQRSNLVVGLAGHHWRLYQTSPTFKAQIDALASLLPTMVNGLAVTAEEADVVTESRRRQLEAAIGPGLMYPKDFRATGPIPTGEPT